MHAKKFHVRSYWVDSPYDKVVPNIYEKFIRSCVFRRDERSLNMEENMFAFNAPRFSIRIAAIFS